jgi:hypothetical protein
MPRTTPAHFLSCLAILLCLSACETNSHTSGGFYEVSAPQTGFYKYGPAQTFGPDFSLPRGAKVTMLQNAWGFARVMTDDGTAGYVASDDLKPALLPPTDLPTRTGSSGGIRIPPSGKPKRSNVLPTLGSPLFEAGDLPLPDNSQPPKPAPGFRF